jgi:hypothetical protein
MANVVDVGVDANVRLLKSLIEHIEACSDVLLYFTFRFLLRLMLYYLIPKCYFIVECKNRFDLS